MQVQVSIHEVEKAWQVQLMGGRVEQQQERLRQHAAPKGAPPMMGFLQRGPTLHFIIEAEPIGSLNHSSRQSSQNLNTCGDVFPSSCPPIRPEMCSTDLLGIAQSSRHSRGTISGHGRR